MSTLLDALHCRNRSSPPIWLMRQAGRYLPEYQKIREKYTFWEMVSTPEIAKDVTLMPLKRFDLDAAILFSDILVVPQAMGFKVNFIEGTGPVFESPLKSIKEVESIQTRDVKEDLGYVFKAIRALREELTIPLIGFCGAPFTVASYMIEGRSSKELNQTKTWLLSNPESFHALLEKITTVSIQYLLEQIEAGVQVIQIFDSWANVLSYSYFEECSSFYLRKILKAVHGKVPLIFYCRGTSSYYPALIQLPLQGISADWSVNLKFLREKIPRSFALQGNLDPSLLFAPKETLKEKVLELLDSMKGEAGFIFNLGHGVLPKTPIDSVKLMIDLIKSDTR